MEPAALGDPALQATENRRRAYDREPARELRPNHEHGRDQRRQNVELYLDLQRPRHDIDRAHRLIRYVVHVEHACQQVRHDSANRPVRDHDQHQREQNQIRDIWRFEPGQPAQEVLAQLRLGPFAQMMLRKRQSKHEPAYDKEQWNANRSVLKQPVPEPIDSARRIIQAGRFGQKVIVDVTHDHARDGDEPQSIDLSHKLAARRNPRQLLTQPVAQPAHSAAGLGFQIITQRWLRGNSVSRWLPAIRTSSILPESHQLCTTPRSGQICNLTCIGNHGICDSPPLLQFQHIDLKRTIITPAHVYPRT